MRRAAASRRSFAGRRREESEKSMEATREGGADLSLLDGLIF